MILLSILTDLNAVVCRVWIQEKKTYHLVDFAVLTDRRLKRKESEERDEYLDIVRKLKKLKKMKLTVIPTVAGVLGTVLKGLEKRLEKVEIRGRTETLQTTLVRSVKILRSVKET